MSLKEQTTLRIVLYEGLGGEPLEPTARLGAMTALLEKGFAVARVTGEGAVAAADGAPLLVFGKLGEQSRILQDAGTNAGVRFQSADGFDPPRFLEAAEAVRVELNA